jgi:PAS domain S-box-containing protein
VLLNRKNDNENKLKSYMDNSPFGMFVVDFEKGRFSDANKMAEEMSGYSYEELMEMSPKDLFSKDFFPLLDNHFGNVFSMGKDDIDLELIKKNAETMIVSITGVKLSDTSIIGFVKDVTEERIAERELEHVSLMKNTLLDNTDQMFFLIDQNLRIIDYNKKAQVIAKKCSIKNFT